jgi:hypothetical protein
MHSLILMAAKQDTGGIIMLGFFIAFIVMSFLYGYFNPKEKV